MNSQKVMLQTTLRITHDQADKLDYYSNKMGLSRNQLLTNMISVSLDDLKLLDNLGLLRLGAGVRELFNLAKNSDDLDLINSGGQHV